MRRMTALLQWLHAADQRLAPAGSHAPAADVGELLLRHQERVRRLVHRLLGFSARATEVDDLVQDVLLRAWQGRRSFRGDSNVATWLTAIAVRRVHNHARWSRLRQRLRWRSGDVEHLPAAVAPCAAEAGDEVAAMQRALARLRHADREVLVLHYLEGREVAEIAALLGCRRNAVEQRLARARARLRVQLDAGKGARR
jgi:RNA polymerase sigma-70 factor (ECF subfamily)